MPPNNQNAPTSLKQRALLLQTLTSNLKSSFYPADPLHKSQIAWLALTWKTKTTVRRRKGRDKRPRSQKDNAKPPKNAKRRNASTPKYANVCLAPHSHLETLQPLAHLPLALEGTGLRAEGTEAEEAATIRQETASPILLPTSHPREPFTSQTSSSIPAMNKDRRTYPAQDLLLPETNSLSVNLEVPKDVVDSVLLLAAPDQDHELALASLCDTSKITTVMALL